MMSTAQRTLALLQSSLKSYGPSSIKRLLWDWEYSGGKWNFADNTAGDGLYAYLEKHAAHGSILDLGCGSGNTATELTSTAYQHYVGTDISEVCLSKARHRTNLSGRADKNRFVLGDFMNYVPDQSFDVILFRESIYHIPIGRIEATLRRYSTYLRDRGVFIVRLNTTGSDGRTKSRPASMLAVIEREFAVVERAHYEKSGTLATVIVFRPIQK